MSPTSSPLLHRAAWVLPIAGPPIRDGWVLVENGRIRDIGSGRGPDGSHQENSPFSTPPSQTPTSNYRSQTAILPGLVNAHTHLELSWMRGSVMVQSASSVPEWASRLLASRRAVRGDPTAAISEAVAEIRATGTALVGDVTNTLAAWQALADSNLAAFLFREVLGFDVAEPAELVRSALADLDALTPLAWIRGSVVPHAPYSVSPALFRAVADAAGDRPVSIHVGESREELEFLRLGSGPWRELLESLGVWTDAWTVPRCWPVEYIEGFGLVNEHLLAVHCVHLSHEELSRLARCGGTVVTCPRSNRWTGAGTPPIECFYASGVRVAIGTDSLASVEDLNMFNEMAAVRALAPDVPASRILHSATLAGAEALGFASDLGSIEPGKRAELITVQVPSDVTDVEEYLVGGRVEPSNIRWLRAW